MDERDLKRPDGTGRWIQRPDHSNWGDFGPDDQRGRLNLLTPDRVVRAVKEVCEGKTFCLSLPLDYPGGNALNARRHPPRVRPIMRDGRPSMNFPLSEAYPQATDVACDDEVLLCLQYSTQWDALSHMGQMFDANGDGEPEAVYYNGFRAEQDVIAAPVGAAEADPPGTPEKVGALKLGIENMAESCVQGRGVMVDLEAHFGLEGKAVGYDDLMAVMDADGVVVEEGDMVCFHSGFARRLLEMERSPDIALLHSTTATLNGRDSRLLHWIEDSGLVAMIADTYGVETYPPLPAERPDCAFLPLHEHCLFKLGIHLGELWYLSELAAWLRRSGRYRFLLTAPPLRLPQAVGSPVTPVATV